MTDTDIEATLQEIREQARAAPRPAVPERAGATGIKPASAADGARLPAQRPARLSEVKARLLFVARPLLVRAARVFNHALHERVNAIERSLAQSIGEVRSIAAGQEQRLRQLEEEHARLRQMVMGADEAAPGQEQRVRQLEEEQVRLRQMVLRADEAAQLADRGRRGVLLRIEELDARVSRATQAPHSDAS